MLAQSGCPIYRPRFISLLSTISKARTRPLTSAPSLTCTLYRRLAQKTLFEQFLETILKGPSPEIAKYVERPTIRDHCCLGIDDTHTCYQPIERDDSLPLVFPLLPNLVDLVTLHASML
ncbi:hypothetical protein CPC08DRAFT_713144, partial [Agrocybe pediades]